MSDQKHGAYIWDEVGIQLVLSFRYLLSEMLVTLQQKVNVLLYIPLLDSAFALYSIQIGGKLSKPRTK